MLAAITVFWTTYALILPAITWERSLICEQKEHIHDDSCYEIIWYDASQTLICSEDHKHTDACYETVEAHYESVLVCSKEEHEHTDACFDAPPSVASVYDC